MPSSAAPPSAAPRFAHLLVQVPSSAPAADAIPRSALFSPPTASGASTAGSTLSLSQPRDPPASIHSPTSYGLLASSRSSLASPGGGAAAAAARASELAALCVELALSEARLGCAERELATARSVERSQAAAHAQAVEDLADEYSKRSDRMRKEHESALQQKGAAMRALWEQQASALRSKEEEYSEAITAMRKAHSNALDALRTEHEAALRVARKESF